jgi:hypothetical protein
MNGALRSALTNPWLASLISFLPIIAFLTCLALYVADSLGESQDGRVGPILLQKAFGVPPNRSSVAAEGYRAEEGRGCEVRLSWRAWSQKSICSSNGGEWL